MTIFVSFWSALVHTESRKNWRLLYYLFCEWTTFIIFTEFWLKEIIPYRFLRQFVTFDGWYYFFRSFLQFIPLRIYALNQLKGIQWINWSNKDDCWGGSIIFAGHNKTASTFYSIDSETIIQSWYFLFNFILN